MGYCSEMPPLTKRQKQAKRQCTSGTKYFDNGLVDDLLDLTLDPNYQPLDSEDDFDATDSDCSMSFSLLDCNVQESDGSESDHWSSDESGSDICTGEKRKHQEDILTEFEIEATPDYVEMCARKAATHAQRFWASVMTSVSPRFHSNLTLGFMRDRIPSLRVNGQ